MNKKTVALMLAICMLMNPAMSLAGYSIPGFYGKVALPPVVANQLPQLQNIVNGVNSISTDTSQNQMTIDQNQAQAVINWNKFDIGANAVVYFKQQDANGNVQKSWSALNRIYDANPTQIYGQLKADAKVYLINQNGILFGPGSQVNVNSLVASTLDMKDADFQNGVLRFTAGNYQNLANYNTDVAVSNFGAITAAATGSVFLLAPTVENGGTIIAPQGSIKLISALPLSSRPSDSVDYDVQIGTDNSVTYNSYVAAITAGGSAWNMSGGGLVSDEGNIGMYGSSVTNDGIIRAVTGVQVNGVIELRATNNVTTGPSSLIESPISDSSDTVSPTYFRDANRYDLGKFGGQVTFSGLYTSILQAGNETAGFTPLSGITLNGNITAPSGTVLLNASGRAYMENGSLIDVSGVWVDEPAGASVIDAQLNSVELSDDYGQKNGSLKGDTIQASLLNGSSIGNISGNVTGQDMTARDAATKGGVVSIISNGSGSELIVREGAKIAFAGGGIRYADGTRNTTKLLSGNSVYDISSAPEWITYSATLNNQTMTHAKFGVSETYKGLYLGGGNALADYSSAYVAGSNAGTANLTADRVVLDGTLDGSVTRGIYQTKTTPYSDSDHTAYDLSVAMGTELPVGGSLIIGSDYPPPTTNPTLNDYTVDNISLQENVSPLAGNFTPQTPLSADTTTYLSASRLSSFGLQSITLATNNTFTTDPDTVLKLQAGGAFMVAARRIVHQGEIDIPGGTVDMSIYSNKYSDPGQSTYVPVDSRVFLAAGSVIDVSGERIDNSLTSITNGAAQTNGVINGGQVTLHDYTESGIGVFIKQGATVDVSGGYTIGLTGKVTGGDAGTIDVMGPTIGLQGDLRGLGVAGYKSDGTAVMGGKIVLHADQVTVSTNPTTLPDDFTADTPLPAVLGLSIAPDRFDSSGFTRIDLQSRQDLTVTAGSVITPSTVRYNAPQPGSAGSGLTNNQDSIGSVTSSMVNVLPEDMGITSISLSAGVGYGVGHTSSDNASQDSKLTIEYGGEILTGPGGGISLSAPEVEIAGTLEAQGGNINATATGLHPLTIAATGRIIASGYNDPLLQTIAGVAAGSAPQPGGTVTLTSSKGDLYLEQGSIVDVSGSKPVDRTYTGADGKPYTLTVAGDPGNVVLGYYGNLTLDGELLGNANATGVRGGGLTISLLNLNSDLVVNADQVKGYEASGFDALTFRSLGYLDLSGTEGISVARSLTLDAPHIRGNGSDDLTVTAPWITITNSTLDNPTPALPASAASGSLNIIAMDMLDLAGSVTVEGFHDVGLSSRNDIRLTDKSFLVGSVLSWNGNLVVSDNLTLQASRIYPNTLTSYTINAGGKITVLGGTADSSPIYSAGGALTLKATGGIEVESGATIAAPMGSITLDAEGGRLYLADGSIVTTTGQAPVEYGSVDDNGYWSYQDRSTGLIKEVTGAPAGSVTLTGNEVIVRQGAQIESSGGGSIYSYDFQPGIEGSVDPFDPSKKRYVVLPGNPVTLTGNTVYLSGGGGLAAGYYSLLPEQYAFLPGARVVSDLGITVTPGQKLLTTQGYKVVAGYATVSGTSIHPPQMDGYSVRLASDVLKEGNYTLPTPLIAGDAGTISVTSADTTILDGSVVASSLSGYNGGRFILNGRNLTVQAQTVSLPDSFTFDTPIDSVDPGLIGTAQIASTVFTGKGLRELDLGNIDTLNPANSSSTVTVKAGSSIDVPVVTMSAADSVTLEDGVQVNAVGPDGSGSVAIKSLNKVAIGNNALVHSGGSLSIDSINGIDLKGSITADQAVTLKAGKVFIVGDSYIAPAGSADTGLYLTDSQWQGIAVAPSVTLSSYSDLVFLGDHNLAAAGSFSMDAARISGDSNVTIGAKSISLLNSGVAAAGPSGISGGSLSLTADSMQFGPGNVMIDGFGNISMTSATDLTLTGKGALVTGWSAYSPGQQINISAGRVTTALYSNSSGGFDATDYLIDGSNGNVAILGGGTAGQSAGVGGSLQVLANRIDVATLIDMPAGTIRLTTTDLGSGNGINLNDGAFINARGYRYTTAETDVYDYAPGGLVELRSNTGTVTMSANSSIDVSGYMDTQGNYYGDAGSISIISPNGSALQGGFAGHSSSAGRGGSLTVDTDTLDGAPLASLLADIVSGGFNNSLDLTARKGNITVAAGVDITANSVKLTADDNTSGNGNIDVSGTITANPDSGGNGGSVELGAQRDISVNGIISAKGTYKGGNVTLNAETGTLTLASGSSLDVSGPTNAGGGTVYLRAGRNATNDGVKMSLGGAITGAAKITAEAVDNDIYTTLDTATMFTRAGDFMNNNSVNEWLAAMKGSYQNFSLLPGMEVQNSGDLTIAAPLDLTQTRFGPDNVPGVLTIRASGDLNINGNILDAPTAYSSLNSGTALPSWGINLVAGSDLASADPMAVSAGSGNLNIADGAVVYSESGAVAFAAGNDAILGTGGSPNNGLMIRFGMGFTLGSYSGSVTGYAGRDLEIETSSLSSGAIQTATGNIRLDVGRDLVLAGNDYVNFYPNHIGAVRTTGESSDGNIADYWNYAGGGSIEISAGHAVLGNTNQDLSQSDWDVANSMGRNKPLAWSANYGGSTGRTTEGIATMGGGDIAINSRGDVTCQIGAFGDGNLTLFSGGNITGRFLVKNGSGNLVSMGSFGDPASTEKTKDLLEAFSSHFTIDALGSIDLGTVVNPTLANPAFGGVPLQTGSGNLTYSVDSTVGLAAQSGDVSIYGSSYYYQTDKYPTLQTVLPGVLEVYAGKDINIENNLTLSPSPAGNLILWAGNNITGEYASGVLTKTATIVVSDVDPAGWYGPQTGLTYNGEAHSDIAPLHGNDPAPAVIHAGGDISDLNLWIPKSAEISAGNDIRSLQYRGWNMTSGDVTEIYAGNDIVLDPIIDTSVAANAVSSKSYITEGGPGLLTVQAGRNIDLSTSIGIQTDGNFDNYFSLASTGANLIVAAGIAGQLSADQVDTYFNDLRQAGEDYSNLKAKGDVAGAQAAIAKARSDIIAPLFGTTLNDGSGIISMTRSQISTLATNPYALPYSDPDYSAAEKLAGGSNMYILSRSQENIGQSAFVASGSTQSTGIYTASGGAINIFSGGDINVNESRVMTFRSGDITLWSDQGNVNAGRGSKTSVSSSPPKYNPATKTIIYSPPAVGSGIRAITSIDPSDPTAKAPDAGDIYAFAPQGVIDAGEAGIAGGRVILGATEVLNSQNISFSAGSVGVPTGIDAGVSLGALAGAGSVSDASKMAEQATISKAADKSAQNTNIVDQFLSKFLDVKVIDFDTDDGTVGTDQQGVQEKEKEKEKKKERK